MADEKKKSREVQPTVLEWSRYLVLDKCLRDQHRNYYKEDLVKAVNRMLERIHLCPEEGVYGCQVPKGVWHRWR